MLRRINSRSTFRLETELAKAINAALDAAVPSEDIVGACCRVLAQLSSVLSWQPGTACRHGNAVVVVDALRALLDELERAPDV
jgi:hypothetical protein